jgi:hypothetical protein
VVPFFLFFFFGKNLTGSRVLDILLNIPRQFKKWEIGVWVFNMVLFFQKVTL